MTRGLQHQAEAARGISSRLVHPTPEVRHACFVAGVLLGIGSFASLAVFHDDQDGPKPTLEDLVDIFHVLRGMYAVKYGPTPYEWWVVTSWPVLLSHEFVLLLADLDKVALAVTARYCVLLHEAHSVAWFTSGWGRSLLVDIEATVSRRTTNTAQRCDLLSWPLSRVLG